MSWLTVMRALLRPNTTKRNARLARLEANDRRVADLHARAERIVSENHLGPAIRRALEGR